VQAPPASSDNAHGNAVTSGDTGNGNAGGNGKGKGPNK
jgi:hypothetical protein